MKMLYLHSLRWCCPSLLLHNQQMRRRSTTPSIFAALGSMAARTRPSIGAAEPSAVSSAKMAVEMGEVCTNNNNNDGGRQQVPQQQREEFSGQPYSALTNSKSPVELPREVEKRLGTLKKDVLEALMDRQVANGLYSLADSPLQFTRNLQEMAKYYFTRGGKLIRPTISLLMSAACNQAKASSSRTKEAVPTSSQYAQPAAMELDEMISLDQYRIAMVAEMIHNSTLVHDDVIDESDTRRGQPTVNARWGNKQAVLVGDFILARATKVLCSIGQPPVIETMAEIVEDLVKGELMQLNAPTRQSAAARFQHYMVKTFYKTGSLFANSCKSVAMLSACDASAQQLATEFGRNLGLAFQLVDDVLDYVSTSAAMGKPAATDLRLGLATCPVLFAAREFPELDALIERKFSQSGDIEQALELVHRSRGLQSSRELARQHGEAAIGNVMQLLPEGGHVRDCLVDIVQRQLERDR